MAQRARLKASDADREHVAERLRQATAEGRLLAEELEHRLGSAFAARTYGELDALVADLPRTPAPRSRRTPVRGWLLPGLGLALAAAMLLVVIAAVLFIVTSVLAVWMLWAAVAWWCFGRRHRPSGRPYRKLGAGAGPCRRGAHPRPSFWV